MRMSTDMQRYSIEHQAEAIALYAAQRGLTVVRTYEDAGRSGLSIDGRTALQDLMRDVRSGFADFGTIIVYDVSRWGRFQDTDESAYYEFLCREAGVKIEYCAEEFKNDGSLTSAIIKNIKRAMAGEFSRELSAKVFAGQCRIVSKGFFVGSMPGFGLRRFLVDEFGRPKTEMNFGQQKALSSDRTILVPGPPHEVKIVHDIYDMFIDRKFSMCRIARELNDRGVLNSSGRKWCAVSIRQILANPKYNGAAVYNRTSKKLNSRYHWNPASEWIKVRNAFEPVVSDERFRQAQRQIKENARAYTEKEMLDSLTAIWCKEGYLNASIVGRSEHAPCVNAYKEHFGGLVPAYRKIGYVGRLQYAKSPQLRKSIVAIIAEQIGRYGGIVSHDREYSQICINEELEIAVVAGCVAPKCGKNQWQVRRKSFPKPDILVVVRVDDTCSAICDYLLIPLLLLPSEAWLTITNMRLKRLAPFKANTLDPLFRLCERVKMKKIDD
ncbi:MAG: recombinase family protein [Afipia sp.]